ncbi:MAG: SEC-C domain-containing protein, partial [Gemmatimonadetes bacterium]|nr:SEC-C domain-containing protein [Gemmatimonadota bacterium]
LMRLFGTDRIAAWMDKSGSEEGEVITGGLVTAAIGTAQKRVELQNFQARKRLLEYDDVMNQQREVVYSQRLFALERGEELRGEARKMVGQAVDRFVRNWVGVTPPEDWDRPALQQALALQYMVTGDEIVDVARTTTVDALAEVAVRAGDAAFDRKLEYLRDTGKQFGVPDADEQLLSQVTLSILDDKWKDHLYDLDNLRAAIHYRSYGQRDPLVEYKTEAFEMFEDLLRDIQGSFTERFLLLQVTQAPPPPPRQGPTQTTRGPSEPTGSPEGASDDLFTGSAPKAPALARAAGLPPLPGGDLTPDGKPIGRNDPCWCGSGKKYKKCHGAT